jgi:hypothetical protein
VREMALSVGAICASSCGFVRCACVCVCVAVAVAVAVAVSELSVYFVAERPVVRSKI